MNEMIVYYSLYQRYTGNLIKEDMVLVHAKTAIEAENKAYNYLKKTLVGNPIIALSCK